MRVPSLSAVESIGKHTLKEITLHMSLMLQVYPTVDKIKGYFLVEA
jgi:hypothetical protein